MALLRFTLKHFWRLRRMYVLVWAVLLLAVIFLAGLPLYTTAVAGHILREQVAAAPPAARNVLITPSAAAHDANTLSAAVWGDIQAALGDLVQERVEIRDTGENAVPMALYWLRQDGEFHPFEAETYLRVWAFNVLESNVDVVDGRFPSYLQPDPTNLSYQEQEVAVGRDTAERLDLRVGDVLRTQTEDLHLRVVGIVAPTDPAAALWQEDLAPFESEVINRGNRPDLVNLSLLVPVETIETAFPAHREYWRVLTDASILNIDNAPAVRQSILDLRASQPNLTIESGLLALIENHLAQLDAAQTTVFLLAVQSLVFVLYTIAMVSSFLVDRSRSELATLVDRGFTGRQLTLVYALEGLVVAFLLAAPLGPPLAQQLLRLWAGEVSRFPIPTLSWQLAAGAALAGWLALIIPIYFATRGNSLSWQRQQARPGRRTAWQRVYLDVFLLALGALIYWQLWDTGSFLNRSRGPSTSLTPLADPLLLLGPTLLLMAVALLFLRLFPLLLRLAAWFSQRLRGLILPFGVARLARDPVGPGRVILLTCLAVALTFFAVAYDYSLSVRQAQMAYYLSGADLVASFPPAVPAAELNRVAVLPDVLAASPVYRNDRVRYSGSLGRQATLLAVEPERFPTVTGYPPAVSTLTLSSLLPALQSSTSGAVPAIFSSTAHPLERRPGDQITYFLGDQSVTFEVRGVIVNFPAVSDAFIITDLRALAQAVDLTRINAPFEGRMELWMVVRPGSHEALQSQITELSQSHVAANSDAMLRTLRADLPAAEALGAFNLNAFILVVLSVAVFLLVHYFSARQRLHEFSVLRALGLSARQLLGLLTLEGLLLVALGLAAGTLTGYALALVMRPFLSDALNAALAGGSLYTILFNWPRLLALYLLLLGVYGLALLFSSAALWRAGVHRVLRLGEE